MHALAGGSLQGVWDQRIGIDEGRLGLAWQVVPGGRGTRERASRSRCLSCSRGCEYAETKWQAVILQA
jgi:hypothetical protein